MDVIPLMLRADVEHYTRLASELAAVAHMRAERPSTPADARRVLAQAHGFETWEEFAEHVEGVAGSTFEAAADAVVGGD